MSLGKVSAAYFAPPFEFVLRAELSHSPTQARDQFVTDSLVCNLAE